MGKRRRQSRRTRDSARASASDPAARNLEPLLTTLLWALFFARWFVPTEGSAEGDTLWLTAFTLPVAALWFWWQSKRHVTELSPGLLDAAVWSLAGAHIFSAILVIAGEGEKRLAMNMLWEWLSLAVLISTLRQTLLSTSAKERFRQTLVTLGIALALFGIWQHYFWYDSNLREYETLRTELDELEAAPSLDPAQARRRRELHAQFLRDNIPLREPQRGLFERRLRDSSEPLGFFALANSFAGIVVVVTVLLSARLLASIVAALRRQLESAPNDESAAGGSGGSTAVGGWFKANGFPVGCLAVAGFTLLLTKSRTACVGAAAGIGFAVLMSLVGLPRPLLKRILVVGLLAALLAGLLAGGAVATGSLDAEVLSEAPKSLQYRFQYWTGTSRVIAESPWFGVGPGNFRPHYLRHKLAETSEEIADPHNFLLDVMANAGVPGVLALLLFGGVLLRNALFLLRSRRQEVCVAPTKPDVSDPDVDYPSATTVVCAAAGIAAGWLFIAEASLDWKIVSTGLVAVVVCVGAAQFPSTGPGSSDTGVPCSAAMAALVALLVHLLAAGGIAMPAISGCLLALAILAEPRRAEAPVKPAPDEPASRSRVVALVLAVTFVAGFAACLQTAFVPVIRSTSELRSGDYEATEQSRFDLAVTRYSQAAQADPFSPAPLMRLSDVSFLLWEQTGKKEHFDEGVDFAREAAKRNPHSGFYAYQIGRRYRQRARMTDDGDAAESAVKWLAKALEAYPTHPLWNAEYTIALDEAGQNDEARRAARKTLELEAINQSAGHLDRFLPEPVLDEVTKIAAAN